jgi:hypothetical protein
MGSNLGLMVLDVVVVDEVSWENAQNYSINCVVSVVGSLSELRR